MDRPTVANVSKQPSGLGDASHASAAFAAPNPPAYRRAEAYAATENGARVGGVTTTGTTSRSSAIRPKPKNSRQREREITSGMRKIGLLPRPDRWKPEDDEAIMNKTDAETWREFSLRTFRYRYHPETVRRRYRTLSKSGTRACKTRNGWTDVEDDLLRSGNSVEGRSKEACRKRCERLINRDTQSYDKYVTKRSL